MPVVEQGALRSADIGIGKKLGKPFRQASTKQGGLEIVAGQILVGNAPARLTADLRGQFAKRIRCISRQFIDPAGVFAARQNGRRRGRVVGAGGR